MSAASVSVNNKQARHVSRKQRAATLVDQAPTAGQFAAEVAKGERFEFGQNWARFLNSLDERSIARAEASLIELLGTDSLAGKTFLDIGSGSGLFSLAARRLGATVHAFDFDPESVACTRELKQRYFPDDQQWVVESGSVLDEDYIRALGTFDVVYSWGVLHHTGSMWRALDYAQRPVKPEGQLFIAIYNDTGSQSARWQWLKRTYGRLPKSLRIPYALAVTAPSEVKSLVRHAALMRPAEYLRTWTSHRQNRGMSRWHDMLDWVGGYPYETARPDQIFDFFRRRGFTLEQMRCTSSLGCNEFVFRKNSK